MRLPNLPSDLILLAIADLEKVEKDPRYAIDMTDWHKPIASIDICLVCFAGYIPRKSRIIQKQHEGNLRNVQKQRSVMSESTI